MIHAHGSAISRFDVSAHFAIEKRDWKGHRRYLANEQNEKKSADAIIDNDRR